MSRVRSEPAEVWLNGGRPGRFVWRGRLYTVLAIVERPPPEDDDPPGEDDDLPANDRVPPGESHDSHGGRHRLPASAWRCWRVTASPATNVPPAGYRLCHDAAADRWLLSRESGS